MAETMYAWSPIRSGVVGENDRVDVVTVKLGEEVDAAKLGIDDLEFQALVDSGSVRPTPFPDIPDTWPGSPIDYMREAARVMLEQVESLTGGVNTALLTTSMSGPLPTPEEGSEEEGQTAPLTTNTAATNDPTGPPAQGTVNQEDSPGTVDL